MKVMPSTRRDVLKAALAAGTAASMGLGRVAAEAQAARQIDGVLRQAVDGREVPGVVAMAATDKGVLYESGAGARSSELGAPAMTTDTVFRIASMTKAITSVAAMQLVEQGKLTLDGPVPNIDPTLGSPQVLEGFDAAGAPKLRAARRPITLRHLLTHTAGFGYEQWDPSINRYVKTAGLPPRATGQARHRSACRSSSIRATAGSTASTPTGWAVSSSRQRAAARCYFRDKIFTPLGMKDSGFQPTAEQRARQARLYTRATDGSLTLQPLETIPAAPEFWSGGGPLYSTPRDYLTFLQTLLHGGSFNGVAAAQAETVAEMHRTPPGHPLRRAQDRDAADLQRRRLLPGRADPLGARLHAESRRGAERPQRRHGELGRPLQHLLLARPRAKVTGLIMTQILPSPMRAWSSCTGRFESSVYEALKTA
jgi:CubicO group peptidase (beta-lactamase class C family)